MSIVLLHLFDSEQNKSTFCNDIDRKLQTLHLQRTKIQFVQIIFNISNEYNYKLMGYFRPSVNVGTHIPGYSSADLVWL